MLNKFEAIIAVTLLLCSVMVPMLVPIEAQGQAGTTLSASIEAEVVHRYVYTWNISKMANATEVYLSQSNPTAYVEYVISIEKQVNESYCLEGNVTVTNGGERATENLSITIDVYVGEGWKTQIIYDYPVDVSSKPVIGPNEIATYSFSIPVPGGYWNETDFKLTANVTITNHSGWLGKPFGPGPSDTTDGRPVVYIYVNNEVNVEDSNGYSWVFNETGQVTYVVEFNYNLLMGDYEHNNTATIVETGQSSTWTVEVYQEIPSASVSSIISGTAFWDNNYNGVYDGGDSPIGNVLVDLYMWSEEQGWVPINSTRTDEFGYYYFEVDAAGTYKVEVGEVSCEGLVLPTTPTYYVINVTDEGLGSDYPDNDFGFVCLMQLTGAKSKGYWSWSQYNKKTGTWSTRVTNGDVSYINSTLNTSFKSSLEVANFLTAPVLGYMKTALMQQLIATLLNLKYGYINGSSVVYYGGGFQTISDIVDKSIDSLNSGDRSDQEYYKTLLDYINNNNVLIVHPM